MTKEVIAKGGRRTGWMGVGVGAKGTKTPAKYSQKRKKASGEKSHSPPPTDSLLL